MDKFLEKISSRKFILPLAAFLGSIAATVAGLTVHWEWLSIVGVICGMLSAALYAAAEAYVDAAAASAINLVVTVEDGQAIARLVDKAEIGGTDD